MFDWFRAVMVFIGLVLVIIAGSLAESVPLLLVMAMVLPGLALMFIFGVVFEDDRDY